MTLQKNIAMPYNLSKCEPDSLKNSSVDLGVSQITLLFSNSKTKQYQKLKISRRKSKMF